METTTFRDQAGGAGGGASRTFQSLFGAAAESHAVGDPSAAPGRSDAPPKQPEEEEDADAWDDDFPVDTNMESAEEDDTPRGGALGHLLSAQSRQSMSDWADNDDDEDNWKDALQARVDQLELVVEKKPEAAQAIAPNDDHVPQPVASTTVGYAPPVDQRATLTLLPKTNLVRSISAPPVGDEPKPPSKLKAPTAIRSPTSSTPVAAANSKTTRAVTPPAVSSRLAVDVTVGPGDQARKRSNSRDYLTRTALAKEQKRLTKSTPTAAVTSNSVFVRAVVARGNSASGRTSETRITNEAHVDKRAKPDDRPTILALSDAEAVRRHILNDVKKISVDRIVADAKRLQFLEDLHRRQQHNSSPSDGAPQKKAAV